MHQVSLRSRLRGSLLQRARVDRIHIVGAARSGTSMLHNAMGAFDHAILHPLEANPVWTPTLVQCLKMAATTSRRPERSLFVTKRKYGWYKQRVVDAVAAEIHHHRIGLINIVRDPRDSLTSSHANAQESEFYLETDRWFESVQAGRRLFELLSNYDRKVTIRYEDLIRDPKKVQDVFASRLGIHLDPRIEDWSRLESNLKMLGLPPQMTAALHKVRDFDTDSIGKWQADPNRRAYIDQLLASGKTGENIRAFMTDHGYA